ncbi:MAG TPA: hypothetical protein ENJ62_06710 [Bryobacterales bacterium]|nr:hypothetical protein [Bryobacterales bacterium]
MRDRPLSIFSLTVFATGLIIGMFAGSHEASAVLACKRTPVSVIGRYRRTLAVARASARNRWRNTVRARYGYGWHFWTRSTDRRITCWRAHRHWRCRARAIPCIRAGVIN